MRLIDNWMKTISRLVENWMKTISRPVENWMKTSPCLVEIDDANNDIADTNTVVSFLKGQC